MVSTTLKVNGRPYQVEEGEGVPLLWVLRESLGLTGTKFGCGRGLCGACTVHLDGEPTRSCVTRLEEIKGRAVTTIEGLASSDGRHPLIDAWLKEEVSQCGYCQPGQIMTAAALLVKTPAPSDEEINAAMSNNLCRCGTYQRIRRAIHRAAQKEGQR